MIVHKTFNYGACDVTYDVRVDLPESVANFRKVIIVHDPDLKGGEVVGILIDLNATIPAEDYVYIGTLLL